MQVIMQPVVLFKTHLFTDYVVNSVNRFPVFSLHLPSISQYSSIFLAIYFVKLFIQCLVLSIWFENGSNVFVFLWYVFYLFIYLCAKLVVSHLSLFLVFSFLFSNSFLLMIIFNSLILLFVVVVYSIFSIAILTINSDVILIFYILIFIYIIIHYCFMIISFCGTGIIYVIFVIVS